VVRDHASVVPSSPFTGSRSLALARTAAAVVAAGAAVLSVLTWMNRAAGVDTWWFGNLVIGCGLGALGLVLVTRVPENPIGWLMLAGAVPQVVLGVGREWAVYAELTHVPPLPGATWAAWLGSWLYIPSIATLPMVLLLFPDGRLPSRRWRPVFGAAVASVIVGCLAVALLPGPFSEDLPGLENPLGVDAPIVEIASGIAQLTLMVTVLLSIASLVRRTWGSTGEERQQLKWVAFAGSLLGLEVALELAPIDLSVDVLAWMGPLLLIVFLTSITLAILKYRLWDIDAVISISLVYGALSVVLGGAYLAVVTASARAGHDPVALGPSLLAAALIAVAFAPLRDLMQRAIDRRVYGDRSDPHRALRRLSARIESPTSEASVLEDVAESVGASLRLDSVAICVAGDGAVAHAGTPRTPVHEVPLVFRSDEVGSLRVSARPGSSIGPREEAVLASMAPSVGAVVHAVAVGDALQRSRRALVTAREEERRRVRRDLHDGLGPALAAMGMKLDGARMMVDEDPARAKEVLGQIGDDIRVTIADIRRLVYDLRPPALDEIGLVPALAEQAAAFSGPTDDGSYLQVAVVAPRSLPDLPAAVEVAAYRIVSEGLSNVARHAEATRCRVTIDERDGDLEVLVEDDGAGLPPNARHGVGLRSMAERAGELGGACRLEHSPLGGTRVAARLPLPSRGRRSDPLEREEQR
jgi:signal transduction histidine kinase